MSGILLAGRGRSLQPAVHGVLWERQELPVLSSSQIPPLGTLQPQRESIPLLAAIPLEFIWECWAALGLPQPSHSQDGPKSLP